MRGRRVTRYIQKITRQYKSKTDTNNLPVESRPTPQRPRQKVICSLGDLKPRLKAEWLKLARKVEAKLSGQEHPLLEPDQEAEAIVRKVEEKKAAKRQKGK